jgi:hypothetical protein
VCLSNKKPFLITYSKRSVHIFKQNHLKSELEQNRIFPKKVRIEYFQSNSSIYFCGRHRAISNKKRIKSLRYSTAVLYQKQN